MADCSYYSSTCAAGVRPCWHKQQECGETHRAPLTGTTWMIRLPILRNKAPLSWHSKTDNRQNIACQWRYTGVSPFLASSVITRASKTRWAALNGILNKAQLHFRRSLDLYKQKCLLFQSRIERERSFSIIIGRNTPARVNSYYTSWGCEREFCQVWENNPDDAICGMNDILFKCRIRGRMDGVSSCSTDPCWGLRVRICWPSSLLN